MVPRSYKLSLQLLLCCVFLPRAVAAVYLCNPMPSWMENLQAPWPWYLSGPLTGLLVGLLYLLTGKSFGISTVFRHSLAALTPSRNPYLNYNWKAERWNLLFALGIAAGGAAAYYFAGASHTAPLSAETATDLAALGIREYQGFLPEVWFSAERMGEWRFWFLSFGGGLLAGFGARWAAGCTSGHTITGLATFQLPSLISTCCFFTGGYFASMVLLPLILS